MIYTMRRMKWLFKLKKPGSITVEATIVMAVVLFLFTLAINTSIFLYKDGVSASKRQIPKAAVSCPKLLRMKHIGGEIYEQYKQGNNI